MANQAFSVSCPLLLTLLSGAILWIVVMLFEEFVTADLRWDLWVAGGLLFVVSACLGRLRYGIWAPILVAAPLVGKTLVISEREGSPPRSLGSPVKTSGGPPR